MASLLDRFVQRWDARHETSEFKIDPENEKCLVMAAKSEEVGPLRVHDEVEELTIEIGLYFHSHFSWYSYSNADRAEGMSLAIDAAIDFVERVIQDQYTFELQYSHDQVMSTSCRLDNQVNDEETETLFPVQLAEPITNIKKFRWSGPIL